MICPQDQQPCTGDHSFRCYAYCATDERRPQVRLHEPDPQPKPKPEPATKSVIWDLVSRATWRDLLIIVTMGVSYEIVSWAGEMFR